MRATNGIEIEGHHIYSPSLEALNERFLLR